MQKSAHTNQPVSRSRKALAGLSEDKGQKFEPYWTLALGSDRRSLARGQKADQKR